MQLLPLGLQHRALLAEFRCATEGDPFTLVVEQEIRTSLANELEAGAVEAIGSWDGPNLIGLIAFSKFGEFYKITVLAIDIDHRQRRQGHRLKREVIEQARANGATAVMSKVHRDNVPMRSLNRKLGAVEDESIVDRGDPYLLCVVPLQQWGGGKTDHPG